MWRKWFCLSSGKSPWRLPVYVLFNYCPMQNHIYDSSPAPSTETNSPSWNWSLFLLFTLWCFYNFMAILKVPPSGWESVNGKASWYSGEGLSDTTQHNRAILGRGATSWIVRGIIMCSQWQPHYGLQLQDFTNVLSMAANHAVSYVRITGLREGGGPHLL